MKVGQGMSEDIAYPTFWYSLFGKILFLFYFIDLLQSKIKFGRKV